MNSIIIRGAKEHNLKNVSLELPRNKLIVFTGISGSGKSTLAFDTIFAEGQRRYLESLSAYARQFLGQMKKPDVESIDGLSPSISIDQKTASHNPRSTVGTVTEIYDYLRLLYARIGIPHCTNCGREIVRRTLDQMVDAVVEAAEDQEVSVYAPVVRGRKGQYLQMLNDLYLKGYTKARINGITHDLSQTVKLDRYKQHSIDVFIDTFKLTEESLGRLYEALEQATNLSNGLALIVNPKTKGETLLNLQLTCPHCDTGFPELEPRLFSFNSPFGACPQCHGLGVKNVVDPELIIPDKTKTIEEGGILPLSYSPFNYYGSMLRALQEHLKFPEQRRIKDLPKDALEMILHGDKEPIRLRVKYYAAGRPRVFHIQFKGLIPILEERFQSTESDNVRADIQKYMRSIVCEVCAGARLNLEARSVTVGEKSIVDLVALSIEQAQIFVKSLRLNKKESIIADRVLKEITNRMHFLEDVGLGYLTLDRSANTLSGGEAQRIRLASQVGSALTGVLYILDEPSIGLHPRDNTRLLATLEKLRDLGNTVIVVEHDEETIRAADWIVDIGPGAGKHGGQVVVVGPLKDILHHKTSITARYLRGDIEIPLPSARRRVGKKILSIIGAKEHNLKNIRIDVPLGAFVCITGVSGSGKSTLVYDILYKTLARAYHRALEWPGKHDRIEGVEYLDKVILIDQSPIGRTPRSNPATYTGLFSPIRDLFAATKLARMKGYGPGRFSFNVKGGRCEACSGDGVQTIEMQFLPDVYVPCDVCGGKRYTSETLAVTYNGKNINEVLTMTVEEAVAFFKDIPQIADKLKILNDVGLGYIELGQAATTLSGGEAQRIKLATELSRRASGKTLYLLDEPTTGLHVDDVAKLLNVLQKLVDAGNSVVVIEHHLDVMKSADYIIDLGPEGGDEGGRLVAAGTPEEVARTRGSYTGQFLKHVLKKG